MHAARISTDLITLNVCHVVFLAYFRLIDLTPREIGFYNSY